MSYEDSPLFYEEKLERTKRKQDQIAEHHRLMQDVKEVFGTETGKRVFRYLMSLGRVHKSTFTGNSRGMWLQGRQDYGNEIWDLVLEATPNVCLELMQLRAQHLQLKNYDEGPKKDKEVSK